jgi:hypothetical protein
MRFFHSGCYEGFKGGVHATLGALAVACLTYNGIAFAIRREKHLRRNVVLYGSLALIELVQVRRHCG